MFIDTSPAFGIGIKINNINESREILEYFKIEPSSHIEYRINTKSILEKILDEPFKLSERRIRYILKELSTTNDMIKLDKIIREKISGNEEIEDTTIIATKRKEFFGILVDELHHNLISDRYDIKKIHTLITMNELKKSNKLKISAAINILNSLINGHDALKRHEIKSLEPFEI